MDKDQEEWEETAGVKIQYWWLKELGAQQMPFQQRHLKSDTMMTKTDAF